MLKVFERINVEVETRKAQTCFFRGGGGGGGGGEKSKGSTGYYLTKNMILMITYRDTIMLEKVKL